MTTGLLNIGQLAQRSGTPRDTLRYYERVGLLAPTERSGSGYRRYDESAENRLAFIRRAQALGLTLAEIGDIINVADQGGVPCEHVQATLRDRLHEVDARIAELRQLRRGIAELLAKVPQASPKQGKRGKPCVCGLIESMDTSSRAATIRRRPERNGSPRTLRSNSTFNKR